MQHSTRQEVRPRRAIETLFCFVFFNQNSDLRGSELNVVGSESASAGRLISQALPIINMII